jgi:hypothetical protein
MRLKKILAGLIFALVFFSANGQIVFFETGKNLTSFKYENSVGEPIEDIELSNQNNFGGGFRMSLFYTPWHISCDATYNKYNSKGSDPTLGNTYEWDFTNLGISFGIDYEFLKPSVTYNEQHGFSFCLKASTSFEFLLNGTQIINNRLTDLKGVEEFDKPFYFLKGGAVANYYLSKTYVVFLQYTGGVSFLVGNYNNQEQFRFVSHNLSIGLSINLLYRK